MVVLDYSALAKGVSRQEVRQFRRESAGSALYSDPQSTAVWAIVFGLAGIFMISFIVSMFTEGEESSVDRYLAIIAVGLVVGLLIVIRIFALHTKWARLLRLSRFAGANGLQFSASGRAPSYPGMIFKVGAARRVPERITRTSEPYFDFGNLTYTTGSGKNKKTHHWGYVALKLDRMLPQIVLDAKSNNLFSSNLPSSISRNQVLSLEGDFDQYFTLYCPKGYERDALYVLTPDLMARLIDEAAGFDVEIVDDWLFFYSGRQRDFADASDLAPMFSLIDTVGTKTLDRTERYADSNVANAGTIAGAINPLTSRMSANTVAPRGRRLSTRVPLVGVLVAIAVAAVLLLNFASQFISH